MRAHRLLIHGLPFVLAAVFGSTAALAEIHIVNVTASSFVPSEVRVAAGDTVRWVWNAGIHTVTSGTPCTPDGIYFDVPMDGGNPVFEFIVPDGVAEIPYFCQPHCFVGMTGTIRVTKVNFQITLDGFSEVPPTGTTATGSGTASLDLQNNLFSWNVTFSGLSSPQNGAHFHGAAGFCETAGVRIGLPLGSPIVGSQTLTAQQASEVLAGRWYLNIHTQNFGDGEIRGQVVPTPLDDPIPGPIPAAGIILDPVLVADELTAPNWAAGVPSQPGRLYVTDQDGILWAIDLATGSKSVFLDVSARLVTLGIGGPNTFDERGLLGVALHPDYASNGRLYTYTSEPDSAAPDFSTIPIGSNPNHQTVIAEWTVPNPSDPNSVVDPNSRREILRIDQPQFNHNAGCLNFGPDGMLYIALGDGGGRDDRDDGVSLGQPLVGHGCSGNGQNINSILGKFLRLDVDGNNSANGQYGIPGDNPFVGVDGIDEIFAYGFRNPFRFSFDSMTGDLYAGDVGQNDIEEVHIVESGGNYGWRHKEGSFFFIFNGNQPGYVTDRPIDVPAGMIDPIAEYDHDEGISVIGGYVYRSVRMPSLVGRYVFGEFARTFQNDGRLFMLDNSNQILEFELAGGGGLNVSLLGLGSDANGEIYVLGNTTGTPFGDTGVVMRVRFRPGDADGDGCVAFSDLVAFLADYGCTGHCFGDFDNNGSTGFGDLVILLGNYGSGCP